MVLVHDHRHMSSLIFATIFGLALGSFANVLIDRVPVGRSIGGRSQCDRCRRRLSWWELLPIVSALLLRFRCRTCHTRIPARLLLVELAGALLIAALVRDARGAFDTQLIAEVFGLFALGVLAMIDASRGIVPDAISVPAIVTVAVLQLVRFDGDGRGMLALFASIAAGAGLFVLQRVLSRGRWVGDGDVRVGALLGAVAGTPLLLLVGVSAAYIIGGALAIVLLALRRVERRSRIPFVPFLFLGGLVAIFWGTEILEWYGMGI